MIGAENNDKDLLREIREVFPRDKYDKVVFESNLLTTEDAYVAWLDIMGAGAAMRRSLEGASAMVGKFHACIINAYREASIKDPGFAEVQMHSMTDGAYIVARSPERMQSALRYIMKHLVEIFLESKFENKFLVRCAIAHGTIVPATTMSKLVAGESENQVIGKEHVRNVTLGVPFEKAYKGESFAPPFGVYVDESARSGGKFGACKIWKWWDADNINQAKWCRKFDAELRKYFRDIRNHYYTYEVPAEKIANYSARCSSYYLDDDRITK